LIRKISAWTASSIVIANMIGTGVFTSVGFQLSAVQNTWSILLLWLLGGMLALFGAFAYAELGTHFTSSGGDYIYLTRVFHPLLGFLSAWAGLTVGFSAPVALAAIAFTRYLRPFGLVHQDWIAILVIIVITVMHSLTLKHSSRLQNYSTIIKVMFIMSLIGIGLLTGHPGQNALDYSAGWEKEITSPGFAVSMVFVAYAYTGWNAAAYIAGEISNPARNLPRALIRSTFFVAVLYILFNWVLLMLAPAGALKGREEVSYIAFSQLLGEKGGRWVSFFIAIQLIATISSYLWVGPRVTMAMAQEHALWKPLSDVNRHGIPVKALWVHASISIALSLTGSFEKVLLYAGFVLQLMTSLTVAASLFISNKKSGFFTTPWKPLPQLIFLAFNAWVLVFTAIDKTTESMSGLLILLTGVVIYYFGKRKIETGYP
jgi:APA family basic amino acid/polyamine antiporter